MSRPPVATDIVAWIAGMHLPPARRGRRGLAPADPDHLADPEGRLDKGPLLRSFMDFWAQHGEPLLRTAPYHEVAPRSASAGT